MMKPKILIVDDEIIIARELEVRLGMLGYDVSGIASSGNEAIDLALQTVPDLVLMDIVLKGSMDGIEAAMEIRRRLGVPIIYLTAYTDRRTLDRAKVTEPFGYVVKPFSERELNATIEMALYRHRVESRLRKVERWFSATLDEVDDAVIAADSDGVITVFNPAAEAITRWRRENAIGRPLREVLRLIDRASGEPLSLDEALDGPMVLLADETLLVDGANDRIPVDNTTICIRNEDDQPHGTVCLLRDPSGQRNGSLVALNSDVAMAVSQSFDLRGMLRYCCEAIIKNLDAVLVRIWMLNSTADTLTLRASAGLYTHIDGRYMKIAVGESLIGGIARDRVRRSSNDLRSDSYIADPDRAVREGISSYAGFPLLVDDHLVGVLGVFGRRSISDDVLESLDSVARAIAVGIERKHLEEQIRQIQKMDAIGQLAGGIAHDFNNILTIISGYSQILLGKNGLDQDTRELLGEISAAGERAAGLTRQLLTFSRKQVTEPRILDLNSLITDLKNMLHRLIGEGIALTTVLDPQLSSIAADPSQIEQVIMNLVVNAHDAMPSGGKLTIETCHVELDEGFARTYPSAKAGCYVMLAVSDTGVGMTPEVQAHIFEPFFTTKGKGRGTGLGLATVYGVVRQSGGYVSVYSEPGLGTTFKVYLPCAEREGLAGKAQSGSHAMPRGTETILLVEDEHAVRALSRYVLQDCGYTVLDAGDGEEAISVAGAYKETIDLLITDVVLPEVGGRYVAERLSAARPDLKILYMSGYTDDAVIRHGVLQADVAFIQKPFTPAGLANKVREVLDQEGAG